MSADSKTLDRFGDALDRLHEAHWHMHMMELHFHEADPFRFSLNSFLRALKEVPQIVQMRLQNLAGFTAWYASRKDAATSDALVTALYKQRDILVHREALLPLSSAEIGITRGSGLKFGLSFQVDPMRDSDALMSSYIDTYVNKEGSPRGDLLGVVDEDDEDTMPCVIRSWRLRDYPADEAVELAARAWRIVGGLVSETMEWLGAPALDLSLKCRHNTDDVRLRMYPREWITRAVKAAEAGKTRDEVQLLLVRLRHARPGVYLPSDEDLI